MIVLSLWFGRFAYVTKDNQLILSSSDSNLHCNGNHDFKIFSAQPQAFVRRFVVFRVIFWLGPEGPQPRVNHEITRTNRSNYILRVNICEARKLHVAVLWFPNGLMKDTANN